MRRVFILTVFTALFSGMEAQEISVTASVDTQRIYIGDHVNYLVTVDQPGDVALQLPLLTDTLAKNIEILGFKGPDTTYLPGGRLKIMNKYLLTSFDTGFYNIPPYYAELKTGRGIERFYSDYVSLEVLRVSITPADTTDVIFDIIGPRKVPLTAMEIIPWILIALVACGAIYLLARYLRNRGRTSVKEEKSLMPSEPIHITALRELDKLEKMQLWQKGSPKEHYSILTEILRKYFDSRFNISSMEMTSSETLETMRNGSFLSRKSYGILEDILLNADLSKFAKYVPDEEFNSHSVDLARGLVRDTTEEMSPTEDGEDGKEASDG